MDPELKKLIEETHALARENHHLLENVRRHQIIEMFGKWVIYLVLLAVAGYFYAQYLLPLADTYLQAASEAGSGQIVLPSGELQKLIESYRSGQ
jgi:hypothetical protein